MTNTESDKLTYEHLRKIVYALIGPIDPLGDTSRDNKRLDNLEVLCSLVYSLVSDINDVKTIACNGESSILQAKRNALIFLKELHSETL